MNSFSHTTEFIAKLKDIEVLINQNELSAAVAQLNSLSKTASHDPRLFLLGSRLAEASRNPAGMVQAARKAHALAPEWPVATMHLASVLTNQEQASEALELAAKALQQSEAQTGADLEMLSKAASLAQRLGRHAKALEWLGRAEQLSPDDLIIRHQVARTLASQGNHAQAGEIYTDLLSHMPNQPMLLLERLRTRLASNENALAIQDANDLVGIDPDNEEYQFYLTIARGETPTTQPVSVVRGMFDGYADHFDRQLVVVLNYQLPKLVAQMIHQWHPDRKCDVLDLGCGTGLLGVCLGRLEGVLVGVDLSRPMLEEAARHNVYDRFHHVNVLDALHSTPENLYHVIAALDVLIYIGNLETVIPNAHRILVPGGRFVFSCEVAREDVVDFELQKSYRYAHQRAYVLRLLSAAGFEGVEVEDLVLRKEAGLPVQGFVVTAKKSLLTEKAARKPSKKIKPEQRVPGA